MLIITCRRAFRGFLNGVQIWTQTDLLCEQVLKIFLCIEEYGLIEITSFLKDV